MKLLAIVIAGVLLLTLIGLAVWLYTPDQSRAALTRKYDTADTEYLLADGITLRVRDSGARDAPAILLLHGFGASLETWEPWAQALSRTYRVVRFDLPGFGLTGPDPEQNYSDERAERILAALLDQLGIARAVVAGNSLGGRIAWRFAADDPARVAGLILISPDGFASPGFSTYGKAPDVPFMMRLLPYTLPRFLLRMNLAIAYANPNRLSATVLTRYRDLMLAPGDRAAMLARMGQTILPDPEPLLRRILAPTLILWGERDGMIPFSNAADYARDIPHARLVALPGLGHVPFEEAPAESLAPVMAFLLELKLTKTEFAKGRDEIRDEIIENR